MEDGGGSKSLVDGSFQIPSSESKEMAGQRRGSEGILEKSELGPKRVKMRDLESVFQSEGIDTHDPKSLGSREPVDLNESANVEMSQATRNKMTQNSNVRAVHDAPPILNINQDPFHPYKANEQKNPRDVISECGSTCGSPEEKDAMKVWKEMKQNGFFSCSHGGLPMPKPRGRKPKNDGVKKKIEIAKREQVNRFAKVAAPSGLLKGLNPGIINHVRNRKQVHSIIEALVKSERQENCHAGNKQVIQTKSVGKEAVDGNDLENRNGDLLALKLSSSATMASKKMSLLSDEESANVNSGTSLSFKAANVASQWLEFLHQDIKGRLTALRCSKKRVEVVIQTELPLLISRELSSKQENDLHITKHSAAGCSDSAAAEMHRARWSALFDQMDKALSEEEKQLESSLTQIREMVLHCEHGLLQCRPATGLQLLATLDKDSRLPRENTAENDLAVRAAAASIYSTCNFLQSMEILPCC